MEEDRNASIKLCMKNLLKLIFPLKNEYVKTLTTLKMMLSEDEDNDSNKVPILLEDTLLCNTIKTRKEKQPVHEEEVQLLP